MFHTLTVTRINFLHLLKVRSMNLLWHLVLKNTRTAIGPLSRVVRLVVGKVSRSWVLAIIAFVRVASHLLLNQGTKGLARYLKTCQILLIKGCARDHLSDTLPLGARVGRRGGLPSVIPSAHRKLIRIGDVRVVRLWMSLFGLYRVLDYRGVLKTSTITDPGSVFDIQGYRDYVPVFFTSLETMARKFPEYRPWYSPRMILKSGPGSSSSSLYGTVTSVLVGSALALFKSPLWYSYRETARLLKVDEWASVLEITAAAAEEAGLAPTSSLGKLGTKDEPGKVRVFAMVDWWTQNLLEQLHNYLFSILRLIPQDGTFNQDAAVAKMRLMSQEPGRKLYSLDLSAATDRLPISIQIPLVDHLFEGLGPHWASLLTRRGYTLGKLTLFYTVGQPMGALSSWAMLALTHHFIVQISARKCGFREWFSDYVVLGDDIVIANPHVAQAYLATMKELGVGVSPHKSLVSSNGCFEFAKRFIFQGSDASPISFAEMAVASTNLAALEMLLAKVGRYRAVTGADVLAFLGRGYRVRGGMMRPFSAMSRHLHYLFVFLTRPGGFLEHSKSWAAWLVLLGLHRPGTINTASALASIGTYVAKAMASKWHAKRERLSFWEEIRPIATFGKDQGVTQEMHHNVERMLRQLIVKVDMAYIDTWRKARSHFVALESYFKHLGPEDAPGPSGEVLGHFPKWMVDEALDRLIVAEQLEAAATMQRASLLVRKETEGLPTVGRWLTRYIRFRKSAQKARVPNSVDVSVVNEP